MFLKDPCGIIMSKNQQPAQPERIVRRTSVETNPPSYEDCVKTQEEREVREP